MNTCVMKNMKLAKKGSSYKGRQGKSEFYNPEREAFSQTTVCLRPRAVLKTSNTVIRPVNNLLIKLI